MSSSASSATSEDKGSGAFFPEALENAVNASTELDEIFPEISFVRDNGGKLWHTSQEAKMKQKIVEAVLDEDEKKIAQYHKKVQKIVKKKTKRKKKFQDIAEDDKLIYRAFVSCNKSEDKEILLDEYRMSNFKLGYLFQSKTKRWNGRS